MPVLPTFGPYLRQQRGGQSLRELGERAGLSAGYLSKLETGGIQQPAPQHLKKIAVALDLDYLTLLKEAGYL